MIILFLLFIFLSSFVLFVASRHDFVLLRQNISIRHVFDKAGLILLLALPVSRAIYLLNERMYDFFIDPLRFLHVILFFGFSIFGLFVALSMGVILFFRKKKNFLRILDIYLLSFFPLFLFEAIFLLVSKAFDLRITVSYMILTIVLFFIFIKMHSGFKIKDGVVSFCILIFSSIVFLASSFLQYGLIIRSPIQILSFLVIAVSVYCLVLIQINFFKEK